MIKLSQHSNLLRAIFAVLFIVSSSGFAVVLNRCVMGKMECCTIPLDNGRDDSSPQQTSPSFQTDFVCYSTILIGGMTTSSGLLVEKNQNHKQVKSVSLIPLDDVILHSVKLTVSTLHLFETPPTPAMVKYILNASFLI
jgi:hypothetical protein